MAEKALGTVRDMTQRMFNELQCDWYDIGMLELLPKELVDKKITARNRRLLSRDIDDHRFFKQGYLARMLDFPIETTLTSLGVSSQFAALKEALERQKNVGYFSSNQLRVFKEINFLWNLGIWVSRWHLKP